MDMQCNDFLIMHRYVLPHFCAFTLDVFIGFLYLFIVRPNTAVIETPFYSSPFSRILEKKNADTIHT